MFSTVWMQIKGDKTLHSAIQIIVDRLIIKIKSWDLLISGVKLSIVTPLIILCRIHFYKSSGFIESYLISV